MGYLPDVKLTLSAFGLKAAAARKLDSMAVNGTFLRAELP